jgi:integrase
VTAVWLPGRRAGLDGCGRDELVFCGPGGSNGVPRGARSRLSVGNYRRAYRLAVARAELPALDPHGPHDLRHTFATWLSRGFVEQSCCASAARLGSSGSSTEASYWNDGVPWTERGRAISAAFVG